MSQIESQSGPAGALRRNRLPETDLPGVTERLATPGLEITPPVSEGARVADSLLNAFSALGGASAAIVRQRAIDADIQRERDRIAKANAREVEAADRGLANQHSGQDLPDIVSRVQRGELAPEDGESVRDFVQRIARDGTDGQSDAYVDQRVSVLGDNVAAALQKRRDFLTNQAQADNAALAVQSIDGASDPAAFAEAVNAVRKFQPDMSPSVAEAEVGKRWLDNAVALAGTNPEQATKILAAARGTLGDRLKTEQLIAQNRFDTFIKQDQAEKLQTLKDDVGKMLDANAPYSSVLSFISSQGERLGINVHGLRREVDTEHNVLHNRREIDQIKANQAKDAVQKTAEEARANLVAEKIAAGQYAGALMVARGSPPEVSRRFMLSLVDQVQSHAARAARDSAEQVKAQEKFAFTNSALANAAAMVDSGLGNLIDDADGVASDGTAFNMKASELREQAMTAKFGEIANRYRDNPERARAEQVKVAADNAYFPGGWKSLINGAAAKVTIAEIAASKDGTFPADATEGYKFYKQLSAQAPGLLNSMNLDSRTKELFTMAAELEKIPLVGNDPVAALTNAAQAVDSPRAALGEDERAAMRRALDLQTRGDLAIAQDAAKVAHVFRLLGQPTEDAVAKAIEQVSHDRIKINGWSSRIGNVPPELKYQFADVAENKIDAVVKAIEGTGLDRGDLAFRYNDQTDLWQIVQRDTGLAVLTDNPDETFFSTRQLITEASGLREDEARKRFNQRQSPTITSHGFFMGR